MKLPLEGSGPYFEVLRARLLFTLNQLMRNGEFSETGLGKKAGISQSHVANILYGRRALTFKNADGLLILRNMTVLDLLTSEELSKAQERRRIDSDADCGDLLPDRKGQQRCLFGKSSHFQAG